MNLSSLALFAAALAAACAIPGPATTAVVARVLSQGLSGAWPLCAGLLLGDLLWCGASMFGAGARLAQTQPLALMLRYAGAAYLAWLAWKLWNTLPAATATETGDSGAARAMLGGLAIALTNPKTMLFYLALLPTIIDGGDATPLEFALPALTITIVYGSVLMAYALAATAARSRLHSPRQAWRIRRASGVVIASTALLIVMR
ncbi:LysE family translocator [Dokdonella soli]|uniref:LysE family translocator n=1 Tax=Dokdonella soli TaxID=529810 RepID=A0ABN1IJB5_9GAMM